MTTWGKWCTIDMTVKIDRREKRKGCVKDMRKEQIRTNIEIFIYDLMEWKNNQLDNENVSDALYGFVGDLLIECKQELKDLEYEICLG